MFFFRIVFFFRPKLPGWTWNKNHLKPSTYQRTFEDFPQNLDLWIKLRHHPVGFILITASPKNAVKVFHQRPTRHPPLSGINATKIAMEIDEIDCFSRMASPKCKNCWCYHFLGKASWHFRLKNHKETSQKSPHFSYQTTKHMIYFSLIFGARTNLGSVEVTVGFWATILIQVMRY